MNNNDEIIIRPANNNDDLKRIAELIYKTDVYIYPYWFENVENAKEELSQRLLEEGFIFNINNIDVAVDSKTNEIVGIINSYTKNSNLNYDYTNLKNKNERYNFTITNYVEHLVHDIKNAPYAYISNICVHENYRGKKIAKKLINHVKDKYKKQLFDEIYLDVIVNNRSAVTAYEKNGFEVQSDIFTGFAGPDDNEPDVVSMSSKLK